MNAMSRFALFSVAIVLAATYAVADTPTESPKMTFRDVKGEPQMSALKDKVTPYRFEDMVLVIIKDTARCGQKPTNASFAIKGNQIALHYELTPAPPGATTTPSVSIAAARRVKTRACEMRHAPIAMKTVMTSGNSSGSRDIPKAMPPSIACNQEPRSRPNNRTVSPPAMAPTMAKSRISQPICRCSCGCSVSMVRSSLPILPISLRAPVAWTSACAVPRTTRVPAKT